MPQQQAQWHLQPLHLQDFSMALTAAAMVSCSENEGFENENTVNRIKFGTVVKTGTKTLVATTENFSKFTVSAYKTTER